MKTKEEIKIEVEAVIRDLGTITRHLWDTYDYDPSSNSLNLLNLVGEAQIPLATLLKKIEDEIK